MGTGDGPEGAGVTGQRGPAPARFQALVLADGPGARIELPFDPHVLWGRRERHHVAGSVAGHPWRGPLREAAGRSSVALGPAWLRDNPLAPGSSVEVVLTPEGPQPEDIGPDFSAALRAEPTALAFFLGLPSFYRRNYARWIGSAKRAPTRAARIAEAIRLLRAGQRQAQG